MSAMCRLTANEGDRDMPHRRISLGAMPMAFAGPDMHDVADIDLTLFMLRRHHAGAGGDDQDLVAGMRMPTRSATLAEVHHAAGLQHQAGDRDHWCRTAAASDPGLSAWISSQTCRNLTAEVGLPYSANAFFHGLGHEDQFLRPRLSVR